MSESSPTDCPPSSESSSNDSRGSATGFRPTQKALSGSGSTKKRRRSLPQWCFVPPKEGQSTMKKNVLLFGKTVDVFWCPHHERWDTHRLRDCTIEVQLQSYKYQLEVFAVDRQELQDARQKIDEMETKVKNQRAHITCLEQKLRDANVQEESQRSTGADPLAEQVETLQQQLQHTKDELETTRQELLDAKSKIGRQRERLNALQRKGKDVNKDMDFIPSTARSELANKTQRNSTQTENDCKETKQLLREEQERCTKYKMELEKQVAANKTLLQQFVQNKTNVNGSPSSNSNNEKDFQIREEQLRRKHADKSIYRLSESLATVTGALESERVQRNKLEQDFEEERKGFEAKIQELETDLARTKMLLATKKQSSNGSVRSRSSTEYVKVCRLLVYSHHIVDDEKVQLIKGTASNCGVGGFIKGGSPGLIVVEGLEEDCDKFLDTLIRQHRRFRESPRNGKVDSSTFAAAGKVISQAETIDEGRAFPKELTQLDNEAGFGELKALCASTGMLDLIDEVCIAR